MPNYKFSGHETFPCRYAWLPKAYRVLGGGDTRALSDEEEAMVALGIGKNMLRALRFWMQVFGVAAPSDEGGYFITDLGKALLRTGGLDPFLEDRRTLWLLHWNVASLAEDPLFAWDYMLNRWQHPEITRSGVVRVFEQETSRQGRQLSPVTLEQHFDVFLHTYVPTRSRKGEILEDNLDCPLVELELIEKIGERDTDSSGKRESIYAFRREAKPDISPELFVYCLQDYWGKHHSTEQTLTFRDVSIGHGSPGQIFKLPEWDIRERLGSLEEDSGGVFFYRDSVTSQRVELVQPAPPRRDFLTAIYHTEVVNA